MAKKIVSRRYYPYYHGRMSTQYSWRSFYVGEPRKGTADWVVGKVPDNIGDGWILGPNGNPARRIPNWLDVN